MSGQAGQLCEQQRSSEDHELHARQECHRHVPVITNRFDVRHTLPARGAVLLPICRAVLVAEIPKASFGFCACLDKIDYFIAVPLSKPVM